MAEALYANRVVSGDDQQVGIAGRGLLEDLPLRSRSLAFGFHLTREHVMFAASERPSIRVPTFLFTTLNVMGKGKNANPAEAYRRRQFVWFLHAAHFAPREGPAKEGTQEGMFFCRTSLLRVC